MEISKKSIDEYTEKLRERYSRMTGWRARGKLLDEYIEVTGYERKYAAKVFGEIRRKSSGKSQWDKKAKIKHSASNTAWIVRIRKTANLANNRLSECIFSPYKSY
ncbi:MAG: hypothetical protein AB8D78_02455 [Akkermansiaceae bacterium]